jgi:2,4-dienoyl-CoA reductase-like NADH-dependent reductase (Old Yellow Enzyme family)/thioredoxin reductase
MAFENLLRPGRINGMEMRNRFIAGPMEKAMANLDGTLNERYIYYSRERAKGGVALIQLESIYVRPEGRGNPFQVGCHDDAVIPGLRKIADAIHEHGAKLTMELNHGGRQASITASQRQPIAPSVVPCTFIDPGSVPREMTHEDIEIVIEAFVKAARRCLEAGVDMIHIHGAHGYLIGQFLSPHSNRRTDEYGGSLKNRARFALEILAALRAVVGKDFPIGYRISAVEFVPGGLEIEESAAFCGMLADAGIDLIDVTASTYESAVKMFQGPESPQGGFVPYAAAIRKVVGDRVPVSVAQRLNDPEFASAVMEKEGFEYISLTRAFHADPHYVRKLIAGQRQDILPCIGCNTCLEMTVARTPAGCAANPQTTFEVSRPVKTTSSPVRVLVVGGGIAGMHAARMLKQQGQTVSIHEASDTLGGQIRYSREVQPDHGALADWLSRQLHELNVPVVTGSAIGVEDVKAMDPDVVVVATGARGGILRADKVDCSVPVFDIFSAMDRPAGEWTGEIAVLGGDFASCHAARHLVRQGVKVHIITPFAAVADDKAPITALFLATLIAETERIVVHPETTAEVLTGKRVKLQSKGSASELSVDAVVVGGRVAQFGLAEDLQRAGVRAMVYKIGDAASPRNVFSASHEAAEASEKIRLASGRPA